MIETIVVTGRFDVNNRMDVKERIDQALEAGADSLIIDLKGVDFMDSAAMAILVGALTACRRAGGQASLVLPEREEARRVLSLTRFDKVFPLVEG